MKLKEAMTAKYLGDFIIVNTTSHEIVDTAQSRETAKRLLDRIQQAAINPHRYRIFKAV